MDEYYLWMVFVVAYLFSFAAVLKWRRQAVLLLFLGLELDSETDNLYRFYRKTSTYFFLPIVLAMVITIVVNSVFGYFMR